MAGMPQFKLFGLDGKVLATGAYSAQEYAEHALGTRYGKPRNYPKLPRKLKKRIADSVAFISYVEPFTVEIDFSR